MKMIVDQFNNKHIKIAVNVTIQQCNNTISALITCVSQNSKMFMIKFFLNLEKQKAITTTARHLNDDAKDTTDLEEINSCKCKFYKNSFRKNVSKPHSEGEYFLNSTVLPNLNSRGFDIRESEITEKDLIAAFKSMPNGKSHEHDGLNKKIHEHFWVDLKFYFVNFLKQCKIDGCLPISQRQAITKIKAKKDGDKRFVKN